MASSSAGPKAAKLAKLQNFKAKLPAHTQAALSAMIAEAQKHGLPELHTKKHQLQAREQLLASFHDPVLGPLVQSIDMELAEGGTTTMYFANFLVYLLGLCQQGGSYSQLFHTTHQLTPSTFDKPWRLIVYCDEIIPGNVLGRATRKCWCIYATFLEYGQHLSQEDAWLTLATERTSFVSQLDAGVSQMLNHVLLSIFCHPACNPTQGMLLPGPNGGARFFFTFAMLLADGAAQKLASSSKGDSGDKFCILCANVRGSAPPQEDPDDPNQLVHTTFKYSDLVIVQDQELLDSYARLDAKKHTTTSKQFEHWQKATGWTWSKNALLLSQPLLEKGLLKPCQQFCHDWMHGILQGTAPVVLYHTLAIVSQEGLPVWSMLERYTKEWVLPAAWKCGHVHQLFDKKKVEKYKNSQRFACQASECLTLFPLVRHFLHTLVAKHGQCLEACEAFFATATVIDIIHQGCHHGLATPAALLQAIEKAIQTFVHLDVAPLIKKWHWLLHLPDTLSRFQTLPSCFTCERKHKVISRFATPMVATKSFDQALLGQVLCQEICTLQEPDLFQAGAHLVDCHKVSKKTLAFLTTFLQEKVENVESSLVLKTKKGGPCHKNDVVAFANDTNPAGIFAQEGIVPFQVGEVQLHLKINGVACALLKVWTIVEYIPSQQHATCSVVDDNLGFVPSDQIVCPLAYTKQEAEAKVLLPYQLYN